MKFRITYLHDPIMHGAIAGLIGGIVQIIYGVTAKSLHLSDRVFMDYGEVLILGQRKPGAGFLIGVIAHLINAAFWGVIFSFIMKYGRRRYYVVKGIGLGMFIWLLSLGLATIYQIPLFKEIEINVAYVVLGGATIYGLIMSLMYKYLDQKLLSDPGSLEGFSKSKASHYILFKRR